MDLKSLYNEVLEEENTFLKGKFRIKEDKRNSYYDIINNIKLFKSICHEYDMHIEDDYIKCNLSNLQLKYIQQVVNYLCKDSNLKPFYTFVGKSAEMVFRNIINRLFYLFRINKKIDLNVNNFIYDGDGGSDFNLASMSFDIKYRNDGPNHGLILDKSFLSRMNENINLIFVTNSSNIKLNENSFQEGKSLPLAIKGWVSGKDFLEKSKQINNGRESRALDIFNPIQDLICQILDSEFEREKYFIYD